MVVTGDITQVDLPPGQLSGLVEASEVLDGVEGCAVCRLTPLTWCATPGPAGGGGLCPSRQNSFTLGGGPCAPFDGEIRTEVDPTTLLQLAG